jgi:triosephosphate isomerase
VRYVLSNWKMYPSVDEARALLVAIQDGLLERLRSGARLPRVIVCPPFVGLFAVRAVTDDRVVALGAQTCHWEQEGPYTGEVSPRMLRGLVGYVMVGHSDRRAAGETDEQVARKVAAVAEAGMVPIVFVGEDERDDDALRVTEQRLRQAVSRIEVRAQALVVVYEPSWAIGAEEAAPPAHIRRAVEHLKGVLTELGAPRPEVIYGGTVSDDNIDQLTAMDVLDGVGATRAGLDPDSFLGLVDRVGRAG